GLRGNASRERTRVVPVRNAPREPRDLRRAPEHADDQRDHEQREEDEEQDFRDLGGADRDPREAEDRRDHRDHEEHRSVMQHVNLPNVLRSNYPRARPRAAGGRGGTHSSYEAAMRTRPKRSGSGSDSLPSACAAIDSSSAQSSPDGSAL